MRQAHDPDLVSDVARILEKTELPPHLLQLELTESALLGPAGRPVEAITALAAMGIKIAVDDFGTGYSNLAYLPRLPLHTMKLAGVLIDGCASTHGLRPDRGQLSRGPRPGMAGPPGGGDDGAADRCGPRL